jgi:hypothetical protein
MEDEPQEVPMTGEGAQDVLLEFDELVQMAVRSEKSEGEVPDFSQKVIEVVNDFYRGVSAAEDVAQEKWQRAAMFVSAATIYASTLQEKFAKSQTVLQKALEWAGSVRPDEVPEWTREAEALLPDWLDQNN